MHGKRNRTMLCINTIMVSLLWLHCRLLLLINQAVVFYFDLPIFALKTNQNRKFWSMFWFSTLLTLRHFDHVVAPLLAIPHNAILDFYLHAKLKKLMEKNVKKRSWKVFLARFGRFFTFFLAFGKNWFQPSAPNLSPLRGWWIGISPCPKCFPLRRINLIEN